MKIIGRLVVLWLALVVALPAHAEEVEDAGRKALELAVEGDTLTQAGDVRGASERYRRAFELLPLPSFALRAAQRLAGLGELVQANSLYLAAALAALPTTAPPEEASARRVAELERQELLGRIPSVEVALTGARPEEVSVFVNGEPVAPGALGRPRLVNPGRVLVRGVRGATSVETSVEVAERERKPVELVFGAEGPAVAPVAAPAAAPGAAAAEPVDRGSGRAQRLAGYVAMGVGGAALLTGGAFTLLALEDESDLEARCPSASCPPNLESQVDTYESKKTIATIGVSAGAVLAVAGLTLILTAPSEEPAASARVGVSLGARGAAVWGAF